MTYGYDQFGGLIPKGLNPLKLLKGKKKAPAVEPPAPAVEPAMLSGQQLALLGVAGAGLLVLLMAGRR